MLCTKDEDWIGRKAELYFSITRFDSSARGSDIILLFIYNEILVKFIIIDASYYKNNFPTNHISPTLIKSPASSTNHPDKTQGNKFFTTVCLVHCSFVYVHIHSTLRRGELETEIDYKSQWVYSLVIKSLMLMFKLRGLLPFGVSSCQTCIN